ncbi:hypothetical protein [Ralstonia phage RP31]|uniref:Uncharacterized protein n=2 Tax=Ripduovirus RP12 TaxID=2560700 RepID=A0A1L7N0V8_9CAUD|nr:hypothetical protein FDH28_gp284 [Ralstonia phage RP12]BAW19111.1 hypothetical protein [Ralstonia phage RP12]BAW19397.1 hypothetical protein [Ralstonia phage RP31]
MATPFPNLNGAILVTKGTLYGRHAYQTVAHVDLNTNQTWDYDMAAALGADASKYDLTRTEIQVFVLDNDAASPTNGFYVSALGVAAIGYKETGQVRVVNQHASTLSFIIRVFAVLAEV